MPDLGKYASDVLNAYAVSLVVFTAIIVLSVVQHRAAKRKLDQAEAKKVRRDG